VILEFTLDEHQRLDSGIVHQFPEQFSRAQIQKIIRSGNVRVNGEVCSKPSFKSERKTQISITYQLEQEYHLQANSDISVPVIYQDEHLAVIHKPPGMTVHPGAGTKEDTLVHVLLSQIDSLSEGSDKLRPGIVHRLDRETEGLMIIAKNNRAHFTLAEAFSERQIIKQYHALVWGLTPTSEEISGYIGRHPRDRKKMLFEYFKLNDTYKTSEMSYETLESNEYFSLLKIQLGTGRTHQIRATMAKLNHPVLGDTIYSQCTRRLDKTNLTHEQKQDIINGGLYLIASRLSFSHPVSGKVLDFELTLPARFSKIIHD